MYWVETDDDAGYNSISSSINREDTWARYARDVHPSNPLPYHPPLRWHTVGCDKSPQAPAKIKVRRTNIVLLWSVYVADLKRVAAFGKLILIYRLNSTLWCPFRFCSCTKARWVYNNTLWPFRQLDGTVKIWQQPYLNLLQQTRSLFKATDRKKRKKYYGGSIRTKRVLLPLQSGNRIAITIQPI